MHGDKDWFGDYMTCYFLALRGPCSEEEEEEDNNEDYEM